MTDRLERNRALHRALFTGQPGTPHAFVAHAPSPPIWEVGDFTTSDRPASEFVPWVVEHYRRWLALSEAIQDDAVPFARPGTGTHIYAVCFGAKPHLYPDSNPYAFNRVATGVGWEKDNALEELGGPGGPVMVPGWVTPECVRTLLRKAPAGTRFIFNGTAFDRADDAARWLAAVRQVTAEQ